MTSKLVLLVLALGLESNDCKVIRWNRTFTWAVVVFSVNITKEPRLETDSMKTADEEVTFE